MAASADSLQETTWSATVWQPLRILTFYRVVLAGLLTVMYFVLLDSNPFRVEAPRLFSSTLLTYLAFSVAVGFTTRLHWPGYHFQSLLQILADIGAIALLMHATGGVTSSLTVLLVIAVAAGSLIVPGRLAYLFAAVATLALLFETGISVMSPEQATADDITRAGLLGLALFATAGIAHVLAIRIRESEALAQQRGIDIENLQQLNQHVIQQLQSGVVVIDPDNNIRLTNDTARKLLGVGGQRNKPLSRISPALASQLEQWKTDNQRQPEAIPAATTGSTLIPRISKLETAQGSGALILLDDSARLAQQTQQIKLASLGRLTASIAHEIRNPLGAISHAAQLLNESEYLDGGDKRLTEIIGNHTRRVNSIIENVLQLSRRSASRPRNLLLRDWLAEFRNELAQTEQIAPGHVSIDVQPEDLSVQVDPGHLHQLLTNLCQNALRHAGNNAQVVLRARHSPAGEIELDVLDNGPGIGPEAAAQMFEPFFTTATSGTGLGLYIARELCEVNQARLSYHPLPEGGSCFRIQFATEPGL